MTAQWGHVTSGSMTGARRRCHDFPLACLQHVEPWIPQWNSVVVSARHPSRWLCNGGNGPCRPAEQRLHLHLHLHLHARVSLPRRRLWQLRRLPSAQAPGPALGASAGRRRAVRSAAGLSPRRCSPLPVPRLTLLTVFPACSRLPCLLWRPATSGATVAFVLADREPHWGRRRRRLRSVSRAPPATPSLVHALASDNGVEVRPVTVKGRVACLSLYIES